MRDMTATVHLRDGTAPAHLPIAFGPGPWLVFAPHDDDAVLGAGLLIDAARAADIAVHVAVVTDGRMGWNQPEARADLVATRRAETRAALADLGVAAEAIHELGFADGNLFRERGCRPDEAGGGLGRAMVRVLRAVAPGAVFTCTPADLHPDHQVVGDETAMACCWAASPIWREFGAPIAQPRVWHYAVYCAFPDGPDRQLRREPAALERKCSALRRFVSQPFIDDMVARLEADGPVEYFAEASWEPYRPATYASAFAANANADEDLASGGELFAQDCQATRQALANWQPWPDLEALLRAPLRLVGEGSSRLFPAGFLRHIARHLGLSIDVDACGGRAAETIGDKRPVLWCSNSGATREVVEAARSRATDKDRYCLGIAGGSLQTLVPAGRVLLSEPEHAVAATASVWMQAFALAASACAASGKTVPIAALDAALAQELARTPDAQHVAAIAAAQRLWWADDESGLADELALKSIELLGRDARAVPGTLSLHGCEELFSEHDLVVVIAGDARDAALREHIASATGVRWLVLRRDGAENLQPWAPLLELVRGWRLLAAAAERCGRDPARPQRARKVGNPVQNP